MSFSISFLEPAEQEMLDAVSYYNEQKSGLGYEFALEVQKTIERIIKYPEAGVPFSAKTRKCNCIRFPYSIIYFIQESSIIIVAVMHSKRKPYYWTNRF